MKKVTNCERDYYVFVTTHFNDHGNILSSITGVHNLSDIRNSGTRVPFTPLLGQNEFLQFLLRHF